MQCPKATYDLEENVEYRDRAFKDFGYGPANPNSEDDFFWRQRAQEWNTTADEAKAIVSGSTAYFGTYTVNEVDKTVSLKVEASIFPNIIGSEQKRIITSITADEMRFTNPTTTGGTRVEAVWKRVR